MVRQPDRSGHCARRIRRSGDCHPGQGRRGRRLPRTPLEHRRLGRYRPSSRPVRPTWNRGPSPRGPNRPTDYRPVLIVAPTGRGARPPRRHGQNVDHCLEFLRSGDWLNRTTQWGKRSQQSPDGAGSDKGQILRYSRRRRLRPPIRAFPFTWTNLVASGKYVSTLHTIRDRFASQRSRGPDAADPARAGVRGSPGRARERPQRDR